MIIRGNAPHDINQLVNWGGPSEITCLTAGAVGYLSQNFKKLGCEVNLVSCVTDDPFGKLVITNLKDAGIETQYITIEPNLVSGIGIYILLFGSAKRPITFRIPTHHGWPIELSDEQREYLLASNHIHCGGYLHFSNLWNQDLVHLFAQAQEQHLLTSLDPQFPLEPLPPPWSKILMPLLKHTDILFLDENEAKGVTGKENIDEVVGILKNYPVPMIIVKMGEKGALGLNQGEILKQEVYPVVNFVDSIGAGDSFDTGFIYAILSGKDFKSALAFAAYTAGKSCEGIGGTATFPSYHDILTKNA
jgi:sugar/nucleoside kinase (ribokinase family)